jgi:hypothetical protein
MEPMIASRVRSHLIEFSLGLDYLNIFLYCLKLWNTACFIASFQSDLFLLSYHFSNVVYLTINNNKLLF